VDSDRQRQVLAVAVIDPNEGQPDGRRSLLTLEIQPREFHGRIAWASTVLPRNA
jgi:hypothetical protein